MKATQADQHRTIHDTLPIGTVVTSSCRPPGAVGFIKSGPFYDLGDRRAWVWVDYTATTGAVGIDYVRELTALSVLS